MVSIVLSSHNSKSAGNGRPMGGRVTDQAGPGARTTNRAVFSSLQFQYIMD